MTATRLQPNQWDDRLVLSKGRISWNTFLISCAFYFLIKSISPPFSLPLSFIFYFLFFLCSSPSPHPRQLALCPTRLAGLQLIDDEGTLPRTGALFKTGRHVLSVGLGWEWITKSGAPWWSPGALLTLFFIASSSRRSLKSTWNLLAGVSGECFSPLSLPSSSSVLAYCI